MSTVPSPSPIGSDASQIDGICDRFEAALRDGKRPRMEDHLPAADGSLRRKCFRELLLVELAYRRRGGEAVSAGEYGARFPEFAEPLAEVFAAEPSIATASAETVGVAPEGSGMRLGNGAPAPATVGKYRVVEVLGSGGQADVFRAAHPHLPGRDVAIKRSRVHLAKEDQARLLAEGRILSTLEHPGLLRVLDVDLDDGRPYVVFDYVRGQTLRDRIRTGRFSPDDAVKLTLELAETVAYVHRQGVVHRDLKPANILIDASGRPRILDFGLSTAGSPWSTPGEQLGWSGTPAYMAPEQAVGTESRIGPWTDVYGLGGILYELLSGRPPREFAPSADQEQRRSEVAAGRIDPLEAAGRPVSSGLANIVQRALAANERERYSSADELAVAIRGYLRRAAWRRRAPMVLGALAATIVAGVLIGRSMSGSDDSRATGNGALAGTPAADRSQPLGGGLEIRVWNGEPGGKRGVSLDDPQAFPVRNGDQIHIAATVNRPAYLYLLWIDSDGQVTRLGEAGTTASTGVEPKAELHSPPKRDQGWEVVGNPGIETVVLLATDRPPSPAVDAVAIVGVLKPTERTAEDGYVALEVKRPAESQMAAQVRVTKQGGNHRGPGAIRTIDDPIVRALERLAQHFELVKAVRFTHR